MLDRQLLENLRRLIIQVLNTIDDILGYQRTIPSKEDRYKLRKIHEKQHIEY